MVDSSEVANRCDRTTRRVLVAVTAWFVQIYFRQKRLSSSAYWRSRGTLAVDCGLDDSLGLGMLLTASVRGRNAEWRQVSCICSAAIVGGTAPGSRLVLREALVEAA